MINYIKRIIIVAIVCVFRITISNGAEKIFYNVKDFGATGDGKTLDSPSVNRAIDSASHAGGGTIYFGPGTYVCGSINIKSNIHLYLDAGSVILGAPQDIGAYDPEEDFEGTQYQDGGHTYFHNSLIWGENLNNVTISGFGMINGGGLISKTKLPNQEKIGKATKSIALKLCTNVVIKDITMIHGGHFAILLTGCNLVNLDNLLIDTNRDGIDIDCCQNVVVSNCRVNSPIDDAICPKSSYALKKKVITENLTITNCQVSGFAEGTLLDGRMRTNKYANGRIKFGTESNGGFRNCVISNCTFRNCLGLAIEEVDGGILENITVSNISMIDCKNYPIYITLGDRNRDPDKSFIPQGKNISISNVVITQKDSLSGIHITGTPTSKLENIRLSNIRVIYNSGVPSIAPDADYPELAQGYPELLRTKVVVPSYGVFARHVKNLELDNIAVDYKGTEQRPPLMCVDVDGLEIDRFKAKVPEGAPAARFNDVTDMKIYRSPILDKFIENSK